MNNIPIKAYQCKKCGRVHYPFHDRCLECKGRDFDAIAPQGNAKLLAYTQIFNLPWGFDERFLIIGVAQFENGVKAMGQVKADSLDGFKSGMKVSASWEPVRTVQGEHVFGLKFEPMK
jgi:uncharacterized OB-fold protein